MDDKERNDHQHNKEVLDKVRSMLGLPSEMPMELTLNLGPLAPKNGPSSLSWSDVESVQMFKVFVKYEDEDGGLSQHMGVKEAAALLEIGPLLVCVGIVIPPDVEPQADILHAARSAGDADVGDVLQHMKANVDGEQLYVGSEIEFEVGLFPYPPFWKQGQVMNLPLILGVSNAQAGNQ